MSESFVPELHDIGKLFDRGKLFGSGCGHTFRGKNGLYDFSPLGISVPDNLTWKGITLHHSWWKIPPGELSSDERDTLTETVLRRGPQRGRLFLSISRYSTTGLDSIQPWVICRRWNTNRCVSRRPGLLKTLKTGVTCYFQCLF